MLKLDPPINTAEDCCELTDEKNRRLKLKSILSIDCPHTLLSEINLFLKDALEKLSNKDSLYQISLDSISWYERVLEFLKSPNELGDAELCLHNLKTRLNGAATYYKLYNEEVIDIKFAIDQTKAMLSKAIESTESFVNADLKEKKLHLVNTLAARATELYPNAKIRFLGCKSTIVKANALEAVWTVIENACQIIPDPNISIHLQSTNQLCTIYVMDNGPGIPVNIRQELFTETPTSTKDGNGIGLHMAYKSLKNSGGSIGLTDSSQGGSIFRITLPIEQAKKATYM